MEYSTDALNFCILPYHTGTKWHERKSCHLEKLLSKRPECQGCKFFSISQPALRQNLKPVSIWIYNEIDSHRFIFEANTPHLFVLLVRCLIILRLECQVEFAFTQIIWLWMIFKSPLSISAATTLYILFHQ